MVQENPALIQPLMQQIATSNPQLAQLINQNPQALYDLLGAGAGGEGEGEDDFLGPQVMHVDLTEADAAAVERVSQVSRTRLHFSLVARGASPLMIHALLKKLSIDRR